MEIKIETGNPEKEYWPVSILPVEQQNSFHKAQILFFEKAFNEGFKPYIKD